MREKKRVEGANSKMMKSAGYWRAQGGGVALGEGRSTLDVTHPLKYFLRNKDQLQ